MNLGKILKGAAGVAVTAGATAVNPALGAILGSALGGGAATKAVGKRVEKRTGKRPHKIAAPIAAGAVPALVAGSGAVDVGSLCETITRLCESPMLLAFAIGTVATYLHQLVSGAAKAGVAKK